MAKKLLNNPKRPPKHWWRGCVKGVRDSGSAQDPESVCGALWYRKMSAAQRREVLKSEGKNMANPKPCASCAPLPNPNGIGGYLIAGAVIAGLAWLLWPKPAAAAQPAPPTVSPPTALPPTAYCPLDTNTLSAWASSKGYALFYLQIAQPPTWDWMIKNVPTMPAVLAAGTPIVVVLEDGSFWTFSGGVPASAPAQKDDYCVYAAVQAGNPVSPSKTVNP